MKKFTQTTLLLTCLLSLSGQVFGKDFTASNYSKSQTREQAKKLNTQGFHLYKQGKYYQALPLFKKATQADKSYVLGQYNLACTAAIVLKHFDCHQDEALLDIANPNTIFTALKQSIRLDPQRKVKSQTDPDLTWVRRSYRYYRDILGYSPNNDRQLREMLENIEWTQATGFYAHQGEPAHLYFNKDSVTAIDNKGREKNGKYHLNRGEITLTFHTKAYGKQQISGRLVDNDGVFDGVLHFVGAAAAHVLTFDDYTFTFPSPCTTN